MSKSSAIQAPKDEKDCLNIPEVKSFLNLWIFGILLMPNWLNTYPEVPDTSIKTLASGFRCFATFKYVYIYNYSINKHCLLHKGNEGNVLVVVV